MLVWQPTQNAAPIPDLWKIIMFSQKHTDTHKDTQTLSFIKKNVSASESHSVQTLNVLQIVLNQETEKNRHRGEVSQTVG